MRALLLTIPAVLALAGTDASAQSAHPPADAHVAALAAGYRALFVCNDVFAGQAAGPGRPQASAADDLEGVYPQYQSLVRSLPDVVDRRGRQVRVAFAPDLPPRIAAWRPHLGCALLPIGAARASARLLPRLPEHFDPPPQGTRWPTGEPLAADPPAALAAVFARAFDATTYGAGTKTTAVLAASPARIIGERYRADFDWARPQRTWSAAKSLTATLVGRAVEMRLLDVHAPADVPEWRHRGDPRAAITLDELMHMASGLFTDGPGNRSDGEYIGGQAVTEIAVNMPLEAAPGMRWHYANNDALLGARALRARLGDGEAALAFPFRQLLWKIGMDHTELGTDWRGDYVLSSQVWSSARDLARLGVLYLQDGVWNGERLLPAGWARYVATPAPAQPAAAAKGGPGYGAFFWLYGPAQGLPAGTYAMEGARGQYVFVVPARGLVIVRRGFDAFSGPQFDMARFVRDVLAALR